MNLIQLYLSVAACLMCAWVAGSFLLSFGRPKTVSDLVMSIATLGICAFSIANAFAPFKWEIMPSTFAVGWRVSVAIVATLLYEEKFGWRKHWDCMSASPRRFIAWACEHIQQGKEAAQSKEPHR